MTTPCEQLGYKVGDQFKYKDGVDRKELAVDAVLQRAVTRNLMDQTKISDFVLELVYDDGSDIPNFKLLGGYSHDSFYEELDLIEPLSTNKRRHYDLIIAWANRAEIEYRYNEGRWIETTTPLWAPSVQYRIKPNEKQLKIANIKDKIEQLNKELAELEG